MVIYTITMLEKVKKSENGFPDFGTTRCVGYFGNITDAVESVKYNVLDLRECVYDYALIECVHEGIYRPAYGNDERWLYKFNEDVQHYEPVKIPDFLKKYCGFSLG